MHLSVWKYIKHTVYLMSSFHREVDENCALLGYYAASSGNFLPTFRDNLSAPYSGDENWRDRQVVPETSVRNYLYSLRNNPEERSSHTVYLLHVSATLVAIFREVLFVLLLTFNILCCFEDFCNISTYLSFVTHVTGDGHESDRNMYIGCV